MRRAAKVDDNHTSIVEALRKVGASVQSLAPVGKGCPDLLVGFCRQSFLLEVKDGDKSASRTRLTEDEQRWHSIWRGLPVLVVHDVGEALRAIGVRIEPAEGETT